MADIDLANDRPPHHRRSSSALQWLVLLVCFAGTAALGWFGYGALRAEKQQGDAARARLAQLEAELEAATAQVEELTSTNAELVRAREELSAEVEAKEEMISRLRATYDELEEKMKEEIARGEIRVSQQAGGRVQVDLVDKILFPSGEAALSQRGQEVLTRLGKVLAEVEDRQIQVSGHTDDRPPSERLEAVFPSNWELSAARAVNVVRFLAEQAGVPAKRLVATGYGEFHPIASNRTAAGRARNRRIEILLTPALVAKPAASAKQAPKREAKPPRRDAKRAVRTGTSARR